MPSRTRAGADPPTQEALTAAERRRLARNERVIERGMATFIDVGRALADIRDGLLYRDTHRTFKEYLRERWDLGIQYAEELVRAARVVEAVETGAASTAPATTTAAGIRPLTVVRAQARRAAGLRDGRHDVTRGPVTADPDTPEVQAHVAAAWEAATERIQSSDDPRLTARNVRAALIETGYLPDPDAPDPENPSYPPLGVRDQVEEVNRRSSVHAVAVEPLTDMGTALRAFDRAIEQLRATLDERERDREGEAFFAVRHDVEGMARMLEDRAATLRSLVTDWNGLLGDEVTS